jgi:hypothetical protein
VVSGWVYNDEPVVYRVETKIRVLELVRNISSCSIFVARRRCPVDTNNIQTVQSGTIYYTDFPRLELMIIIVSRGKRRRNMYFELE